MTKRVLYFVFLLFANLGFSQLKYSLGLGINSSVFVLHVPNHEATPGFPVSPNITARLKRHEILIGSDIYFVQNKAKIFGSQCSYHFYPSKKNRKWVDYYIDIGLRYVRFKMGSIIPEPYNSSNEYHIADGALVKYKSLINSYGFGTVLNFRNRVNVYAVIGAGVNYWTQEVVVNYSWNDIKNGDYLGLVYYAKLGITLKFFNKYESSCAGFPPKGFIKD
jgi:hypothetical protein